MLRALIERELFEERRADYIANMLWSLTGAVFVSNGAEWKAESWGNIIEASKRKPEPDMSGTEIREMLVKRWGGGG